MKRIPVICSSVRVHIFVCFRHTSAQQAYTKYARMFLIVNVQEKGIAIGTFIQLRRGKPILEKIKKNNRGQNGTKQNRNGTGNEQKQRRKRKMSKMNERTSVQGKNTTFQIIPSIRSYMS